MATATPTPDPTPGPVQTGNSMVDLMVLAVLLVLAIAATVWFMRHHPRAHEPISGAWQRNQPRLHVQPATAADTVSLGN